jgi:hypothetical protein
MARYVQALTAGDASVPVARVRWMAGHLERAGSYRTGMNGLILQ